MIFYFDIYAGNELRIDDEGMNLRSVLAAQREAARALAVFARNAIGVEGARGQRMAIWVRDTHGPVMEVNFSFDIARKR